MLKRLFSLYALPALTTVTLQVVVLQYSAKYAPWHPWLTGALVFPLAVYAYKRILQRPDLIPGARLMPWLFFAAAGATAAIIYPKANALRGVMRGSDQDDCVQIVVDRLLSGHLDYQNAYSYFGKVNPCSTGLGEAVLYVPFAPFGLLQFGSVALIASCFWLLEPQKESSERRVFIVLLGSTLLTWNNFAVGSDFLFIGAAALISVLALERAEHSQHRLAWLITASVICGLTASSRVAFAYLPAVLALMTVRERPRASCYFLLGTSVITAAFTFGPYLLNPQEYSPLHILSKGSRIMGPYFVGIIFGLALAGCAILALAASGGIRNGRLMLAISFGVPMALVAISEAVNHTTITAHYLAIAAPAFCAWLARHCTQARPTRHNCS